MNKSVYIFIFFTIVVSALFFVLLLNSNQKNMDSKTNNDNNEVVVDDQQDQTQQLQSAGDVEELSIETLIKGEGKEVVSGDTIVVDYEGRFLDGVKFDSSYDRGEPFSFTIGQGSVIQGWEQGLVGMKVGEIRKLTIPSDLGYGPDDYSGIPGGSALVFEIELIEIK